jgi:hypothetical protein
MILKELYGDKLLHQVGNNRHPQAENFSVIHGHYDINFYGDLSRQRPCITFVRHPVERVLSHYYYWLVQPDRKNPECSRMIKENWNLEKFVNEVRPNIMASLMGPDLSRFEFIGIKEIFSISLARFQIQFGLENIPIVKNQKVGLGKKYANDSVKQLIIDKNDQDLQIYKTAWDQNIEWWARHDVDTMEKVKWAKKEFLDKK